LRSILDSFLTLDPTKKDAETVKKTIQSTEELLEKMKQEEKEGKYFGPYFNTSASYYVKVLEKISTVGNGYIKKELDRIDNIIGKGQLQSHLLDNLMIRKNILTYFNLVELIRIEKNKL
jgi:hypothetical protein